MERNDSQKIKILRWMQNKVSITPQDALTFGCMRLAARIKNLRSDGYDIITDRLEYIDNDGRKVSYASYRLRDQECAHTTEGKYDGREI